MKLFSRKTPQKGVVETLITRGDAARDQHNWTAAADAYKAVVDHRPELTDIWIQYGHALKEAGRAEDAVAAYQHAVKQRPEDVETHVHLGHLLKRLMRVEDAIAMFETAAYLDPDDASSREEIASLRAIEALEPEAREGERAKLAAVGQAAHPENVPFRGQVAGQQAELETQQAQPARYIAETAALKDQLAEVKTARDALFKERNAARDEVETLKPVKDQLAAAQALYEEAQGENELFKNQIDGQQAELEAQQAEVTTLKKQLDEAAEREAQADKREKSAGARLAAAQALYEEAQGENELFKNQIDGQQAELEAQQAEVTTLKKQLDEVKAEIATVKTEREALFQERNAARAKVETLRPLEVRLSKAEAARDEALTKAEAARKTAHDYEIRVSMAREEFLRSEGQIALIKDLVLREDGL